MKQRKRRPPHPIRIVNTRTGRTTVATDGRDAANIVKIEQDRRSFIEMNKRIAAS